MPSGQDTNPSSGEAHLKQYWGYGVGSLKIKWGTPGDFDRCVVELSRHIPSERMREGFCANVHKMVTGGWPGDHNADGHRD